MSPRVSVIVPAYNAAQYIDAALASLEAQTLRDFEAIIVDDASTDDTAARASAFARRDPRFTVITQPSNRGPSAARNVGIDRAAGDWIALLDADDRYDPQRLQLLVDLGERTGVEMCSDNLLLDRDDAVVVMIPVALLSSDRELALPEFVERTMADPAWPGVNFGFLKPIMRRAFLLDRGIRYDERVRFAEDFSLYVDCFRAGARWRMASAATYIYRVRDDGLTQVQTVADLDVLRAKLAVLASGGEAGGPLVAAARRQLGDVSRRRDYRAFTDAVKARQFALAAKLLFKSPQRFLRIGREAVGQAPLILNKLASGGYRRTAPGNVKTGRDRQG